MLSLLFLLPIIMWTLPHNHSKINVDESHKKVIRVLTGRGLIRDHYGRFICGFYNRLGTCYVVWAKL